MSDDDGALLLLTRVAPPLTKTRAQVCGVRLNFNGLQVQTAQYGLLHWFEVALDQLTPADRQAVYAAKRACGDTHLALAVSHAYLEPAIPVPQGTGKDWTQDLEGFVTLATEVLVNGFVPMIFLAGDGQSAPSGYNDPVGWTYGYTWLMANLGRILTAFAPIGPSCLFVPGFDGVFYGWTPDQVTQFGARFRQLQPTWHLGIEHDTGHVPIGNGPADYALGGPMQAYDVILSEFDFPPANDTVWQVAARLLGPAYVRPSDQPSGDDPTPPFYLGVLTPRGPFYACAFEWEGLYGFIRGQQTSAQVAQQRAYLQACGYASTG